MTYKTDQMSVRPSVKTLRLRDPWADIDETLHIYSMGLGTQLLGSRILNFGSCTAQGHRKQSGGER